MFPFDEDEIDWCDKCDSYPLMYSHREYLKHGQIDVWKCHNCNNEERHVVSGLVAASALARRPDLASASVDHHRADG